MIDLFDGASAPFSDFAQISEWEDVVPGAVRRCEVHRVGDQSDRHEITVFSPIDGLAAQLWEHEARSLVSMSGLGHPSLPDIDDGGFIKDLALAYNRTRLSGQVLQQREAIDALRENKVEALRQFDSLLDGLRRLHDNRILHRNVRPDAFRFIAQTETTDGNVDEPGRILLSRFEMSTLVSHFIRGSGVDGAASIDAMRNLYDVSSTRDDRARHLAYLAPERVHFVLGDDSHVPRDWDTTDLYAIGILCFELFFGPVANLDGFAELQATATPSAHEKIRRAIVQRAAVGTDDAGVRVPTPIGELVVGLLEGDPRSRWNAHRASTFLEERWSAVEALLRPEAPETPPLLLAFMPKESAITLYQQRGWLKVSPAEAAGRDELHGWLEHELRNAEIVHSARGATGYARHERRESLEQAEWVLIGERAVWFCAYVLNPQVEERVLVIKFIRERDRAAGILRLQPRRRLDSFELFSWQPGQSIDHLVGDRPSWKPLLDGVRRRSTANADDLAFLDAMDFFLDYQRAEIDARVYAVAADGDGVRLTLKTDKQRERSKHHSEPLLAAFANDETRRPPLAEHFASVDDGQSIMRLQLAPDRRGRPDWKHAFEVTPDGWPGDSEVMVVRSIGNGSLPVTGDYWIRHADDRAAEIALGRQMRARPSLETRPSLVAKLRVPISMDIRRPRLPAVDPALHGTAPEVVRDILARHPIHAVQGPPGTGKTTVATEAIRLHLADDPAARVLVSVRGTQ